MQRIIKSAVLVPLYRGSEGEIRLILIRRSDGPVHGGQLAFPGGKLEPGDGSLLETALRETYEETGLHRNSIRILEQLPEQMTLSTNFSIAPFLACIRPPDKWICEAGEIDDILDVRLDRFTECDAHGEEMIRLDPWPEPRLIPFYKVGPYKLWGASYRILHPLIPGLLEGQWRI